MEEVWQGNFLESIPAGSKGTKVMSLGLEESCRVLWTVIVDVPDGLHDPRGNSGWLDFL